jgi:hypothetical protein
MDTAASRLHGSRPTHLKEQTMTSLSIVSAALAAFGLLTIGGNVVVAQTKTTTNTSQCFTDDGYGRLRSCSQNFKKNNPKWRTSSNCHTDDGYGRYRSCSAGGVGYKRKQPKS